MDDDRALWARIAAHDFEPAGAALTFAGRLAREHGWSLARARACIDEYRRFCFLALRAGREVTPSEEVDEVWHQHLAYPRDYWQAWCRDVLRRDLHHGPTRGGPAEGKRFVAQYADTLAAYEAWFGSPSPALWPDAAERFGRPRFRAVDRATHLVVPVPCGILSGLRRLARWIGLGALLTLVSARPASAGTVNPLDWTAGPFLTLYVVSACAALVAGLKVSSSLDRGEPRRGRRSRFTPAELGLLAGGTSRAADVLILETIATGRIRLETRESSLGPIPLRTVVLSAFGQDLDRAWLVSQREARITDLRRGLVEEGLVLPRAHRRSVRLRTAALVCPVILLGLAKLAVGTERDEPVGVLLFLVLVTAVAALMLAEGRSPVSRAGRALVRDYRVEHARALRAPRPEEVIAAFAVVGAPALAGTTLEAYARLLKVDGGGG